MGMGFPTSAPPDGHEFANLFYRGIDTVEWSNEEVKAMFTDFKLPSPEEKKKPIGAIVGGSIGGAASLIGLTALAIWLLRCRRRNAPPVETPPMKAPPKNATELDDSGCREPVRTQYLDVPGNAEALVKQDLHLGYHEAFLGQELDGGWAAAQAAAGGQFAKEQRGDVNSASELHAEVAGVEPTRGRGGDGTTELPG